MKSQKTKCVRLLYSFFFHNFQKYLIKKTKVHGVLVRKMFQPVSVSNTYFSFKEKGTNVQFSLHM